MSGSGSGGTPVAPRFSCEDLVIQTQIASPKAALLPKLNVGTELTVELHTKSGTAVVELVLGGKVVGGLASASLNRLRECIEQGHTYKAVVTAVNGAEVRVRVEAA
jgi:hypothetical protein